MWPAVREARALAFAETVGRGFRLTEPCILLTNQHSVPSRFFLGAPFTKDVVRGAL